MKRSRGRRLRHAGPVRNAVPRAWWVSGTRGLARLPAGHPASPAPWPSCADGLARRGDDSPQGRAPWSAPWSRCGRRSVQRPARSDALTAGAADRLCFEQVPGPIRAEDQVAGRIWSASSRWSFPAAAVLWRGSGRRSARGEPGALRAVPRSRPPGGALCRRCVDPRERRGKRVAPPRDSRVRSPLAPDACGTASTSTC